MLSRLTEYVENVITLGGELFGSFHLMGGCARAYINLSPTLLQFCQYYLENCGGHSGVEVRNRTVPINSVQFVDVFIESQERLQKQADAGMRSAWAI